MVQKTRSKELEAQLSTDPDNEVAWQVYADGLLEQSEPSGRALGQSDGPSSTLPVSVPPW